MSRKFKVGENKDVMYLLENIKKIKMSYSCSHNAEYERKRTSQR